MVFVYLNRTLMEQGDVKAQHNLGVFYENGLGGVPKDDVKAAEWYLKAAELRK
jgi:TPR repeat protein